MEIVDKECKKLEDIILHQLSSWWKNYNVNDIVDCVPEAYSRVCESLSATTSKQCFSAYNTVHYSIFLYYLSNTMVKSGKKVGGGAEIVYYLNKIMHSNDWFYMINLPNHFLAEHPIGSVLGRAEYGDYFFVYQGTTVGGNRKDGIIYYPTLGENVLMYANSTVLGNTKIGNNVIIAANSYLINEQIPNNCIVFGRSPDITIKVESEDKIKDMTSHIWKW